MVHKSAHQSCDVQHSPGNEGCDDGLQRPPRSARATRNHLMGRAGYSVSVSCDCGRREGPKRNDGVGRAERSRARPNGAAGPRGGRRADPSAAGRQWRVQRQKPSKRPTCVGGIGPLPAGEGPAADDDGAAPTFGRKGGVGRCGHYCCHRRDSASPRPRYGSSQRRTRRVEGRKAAVRAALASGGVVTRAESSNSR